MKRKIKFLTLLPLFGLAVAVPIVATSCGNKTISVDDNNQDNSNTIAWNDIKVGDTVNITYQVEYNGETKTLNASGTISYKNDDFLTLIVSGKARNIHSNWVVSIEK